jgi:hypothetical protein
MRSFSFMHVLSFLSSCFLQAADDQHPPVWGGYILTCQWGRAPDTTYPSILRNRQLWNRLTPLTHTHTCTTLIRTGHPFFFFCFFLCLCVMGQGPRVVLCLFAPGFVLVRALIETETAQCWEESEMLRSRDPPLSFPNTIAPALFIFFYFLFFLPKPSCCASKRYIHTFSCAYIHICIPYTLYIRWYTHDDAHVQLAFAIPPSSPSFSTLPGRPSHPPAYHSWLVPHTVFCYDMYLST